MTTEWLPQRRAERLIATSRLVLAIAALLAIWLDPLEPARYVAETYGLLIAYAAYALILAVWNATITSYDARLPLVTHAIDLLFAMSINFLTAGPTSPFFVYFVFSLICAILRFGLVGTAVTAVVALTVYLGSGLAAMVVADPFELNRFIIRTSYLGVVASLLLYLAWYQRRLYADLRRITTWARTGSVTRDELIGELLEQSLSVADASRVMLAYEYMGEVALFVGTREEAEFSFHQLEAKDATRVLTQQDGEEALREAAEGKSERSGLSARVARPVLPADLARRFALGSSLSTSFAGEFVKGRVIFLDREGILEEDLTLAKIIAGMIGSRLDHLHAMEQLQRGALAEERLRLGRNLHDSLLQSLTGISLQLRTLPKLMLRDADAAVERLADVEKVIADDQRDLRSFIDQLHTDDRSGPREFLYDLRARLAALRERMRQQWDLELEYELDSAAELLPDALRVELYSIISEGVANAAKHAAATRCAVTLRLTSVAAEISIEDNGRGFPFVGRYNLRELIGARRGPATLKERISSLHGDLLLNSTSGGSMLNIRIPKGS